MLLTCYDGLGELKSLNKSMENPVGCICLNDIHDRALEGVRKLSVAGWGSSRQDCFRSNLTWHSQTFL